MDFKASHSFHMLVVIRLTGKKCTDHNSVLSCSEGIFCLSWTLDIPQLLHLFLGLFQVRHLVHKRQSGFLR